MALGRDKERELKESIKLIANNKKAYHDYFIDDKFEAGIELFGTEVKSIRMGKCSIKEAFVKIEKDEVFVYGMHISPYEKGNIFNKDPLRVRKLLLHRLEIRRLLSKIKEKGDEVFVYGMHISPYEKGNIFNKDPLRVRKLLLHRLEIRRLLSKIKEKGYTLVPLQVYFKGSLVKVELGLARGKKLYDKRDDLAKKDAKREVEREFRDRNR